VAPLPTKAVGLERVAERDRRRPSKAYDHSVNGTTPKAETDPDSPVPLHEQVAAVVGRAIASGEAKPGKRLPPARDMAKVLGVNSNTVFRALHTLRDARSSSRILLAPACHRRPSQLIGQVP
jgi:DNA-binding IclR family transcriptional regulator